MKVYLLCINICALIAFIKALNPSPCNAILNPASPSVCHNFTSKNDSQYCCYKRGYIEINGQKTNFERCEVITQSQLENIDKTIKDMENNDSNPNIKGKIYSLDCKSYYLTMSLSGLLLFIL